MLIISFTVIGFLFVEKNHDIQEEKNRIFHEHDKRNKEYIKQRVEEVYSYIQREREVTIDELKELLTTQVSNAYNIALSIYNKNKDLPKEKLKRLILESLRDIRFNDGRGYFFIYDKKGTNLLLPYNQELEGKSFINHQDSKGTYIIQDMIKLLSSEKNAFYDWYWYNPNGPAKMMKKIGYIQNFEPFDWIIGTGEYFRDFEKKIQERVLKNIREIRFGDNGYIFIIDYNTVYLSHIRKDFIGKDALQNNDTVAIKKVIKDLIEIAKNGSGYYSYTQNKKPDINEQSVKKISYVMGHNDWQWMIGTGYYEDDMNKKIEQRINDLNKRFEDNVLNTIFYSLILIFILSLISMYFSKKLHEKFKDYTNEIDVYLEENTKQQNLISFQSRMAAMGEMIGNIAHQWRQPLSLITSTSTGIKLHKQTDILTDEFLIKGLDSITDTAKYLSHTIDDFRGFFKPDNVKVNFYIEVALNKALNLLNAQFSNKEISFIINVEDVELLNHENQLIQVIINVLNNAKDELVKKDRNFKKLIFIDGFVLNGKYILEIKDNAGGVPEDIIDRVFEPYFTTKHQSQGTGIGLFMSREIVLKNLDGDIEVSNTSFEYKDKTYTGANFKLTLKI